MLFVSVLSLDIVFLSEVILNLMAHKSSGCVPWVLEKEFTSNFGHGKNLATWSSDLRMFVMVDPSPPQ